LERSYRRGALVRRTLLVADVLGLALAFVLANLLVSSVAIGDRVSPGFEYLAFFLAIPGWVILLRLEGLYDRDEERTDHSTVDDIVGVFRSVTIGVWLFALFGVATGLVHPVLARLGVFWVLAVVLIPTLRSPFAGWTAFEGSDDFSTLLHYEMPLRADARRSFRNVGETGHWLEVSVGLPGAGIGSLVVATAADGEVIGRQEIGVGGGYSSGRLPIAHFGLGEETVVDLAITLPDGTIHELGSLPADQHIRWPEGC